MIRDKIRHGIGNVTLQSCPMCILMLPIVTAYVSVLYGSNPAGRICCQLSVRRTGLKG